VWGRRRRRRTWKRFEETETEGGLIARPERGKRTGPLRSSKQSVVD